MSTFRFSVELDSTGDPEKLHAELRRVLELTFPDVLVTRTWSAPAEILGAMGSVPPSRLREALAGHYPGID